MSWLWLAGFLLPAAETIAELKAGLAGVQGTARVDLLNRISFACWSQDPGKGSLRSGGLETGRKFEL